jgi:uncharacterized membrane protein
MEEKIFEIVKYSLAALSFGVGVYFARYIKPFFIWIKGGVEDGDNKLQNKELQIAFFSLMASFIIITIALWNTQYPDSVIYSTFAGAGILYAINRATEAYKSGNNPPKN